MRIVEVGYRELVSGPGFSHRAREGRGAAMDRASGLPEIGARIVANVKMRSSRAPMWDRTLGATVTATRPAQGELTHVVEAVTDDGHPIYIWACSLWTAQRWGYLPEAWVEL